MPFQKFGVKLLLSLLLLRHLIGGGRGEAGIWLSADGGPKITYKTLFSFHFMGPGSLNPLRHLAGFYLPQRKVLKM